MIVVVVAFLVAGMALGAIDGLLAAQRTGGAGWTAVLFGAALMGIVGLVFGGFTALAIRLGRKWGWLRGLAERSRDRLRALGDRRASDREPVIAVHAKIIAAVVCAGAALWLLDRVLRRTWTLEEEGFARALSSGIAAGLFIAALVGMPIVAALLRRPLARLDRRLPLPLPPIAELRWVLWLALPVSLPLIRFAVSERQLLGPRRAAALWLLCLLAWVPAIAIGLTRLMKRSTRTRRIAAGAAAGLWVGALALTVALWDGRPRDALAIDRSGGALAGADLARALTDVDRDGASSLLGGGDCAPFDGDRAPRNRDLPGNDFDEDCDGVDLPQVSGSLYPTVRTSGALAPALVRPWNILWITIDALRADHVGAYGYPKETTPSLDALAAESLLFEQAYAQLTRTFFSVASMFAGLDPASMTWEKTKGFQNPSSRHTLLAERLRDRGYRTELVLAGGMEEEFTGLQQGFAQVDDYFLDRKWKQWRQKAAPSATVMAVRAVERLSAGGQPWFVAVHYIDPHSPYGPHHDGYPTFGRGAQADYDGDISYADRNVGFLLDYLRHRPKLAENTVVLVVADHGEEFGEHGSSFHGYTCHRPAVHVPLIIKIPGLPAQRIAQRVAMVDIVPTLLELIGIDQASEQLHGQSLLVPVLRPDAWDPQRPIFCLTASASGHLFLRRSVRVGDLALFQEVHTGKFRLYDTAADPAEKRDLRSSPPAGADQAALERLLAGSLTGNVQEHW